jgi:regulator of protease activity HflC (stomatin/prohibitin superfamily)
MFKIAMVLLIIELAWWLLWAAIALSKRAVAILVFLAVSGVAFGAGAWYLFGQQQIFSLPLLLLPAVVLPPMVRIIAEYERGVLFRLGRLQTIMTPGLNLVFPLGIDRIRKIDMRTLTVDVPKQEVITRDNVPVQVDAVIYFNVFDPDLAVNKVMDYIKSTSFLGQTTLRSVLGEYELDQLLAERTTLNDRLKVLLDERTDPWGIKVTMVEVKAIELAEDMKRAIARQAEAERERRAKVIAAEGELQASEKLAQAAATMGQQGSALQLRYLQTLTEIAVEKNSTIVFPLPMEILKFFDRK